MISDADLIEAVDLALHDLGAPYPRERKSLFRDVVRRVAPLIAEEERTAITSEEAVERAARAMWDRSVTIMGGVDWEHCEPMLQGSFRAAARAALEAALKGETLRERAKRIGERNMYRAWAKGGEE